MVVEVSESGEVRLYGGHEQENPYVPSDRASWERTTAATYTNDALCPNCAKGRGVGNLMKDMAYVYQGKSSSRNLIGAQVYCGRCPMQVVRFRYKNKNHYFGREVVPA